MIKDTIIQLMESMPKSERLELVRGLQPQKERMLTTKQAAEYLGIHPESLKKWSREGLIKSIKKGKRWMRFDALELDRFLSEGDQV